jgi:hypothetical protein
MRDVLKVQSGPAKPFILTHFQPTILPPPLTKNGRKDYEPSKRFLNSALTSRSSRIRPTT